MEQLRATLKSDLQEKNDILDKLTHERGQWVNLSVTFSISLDS